MSWPRFLDCAYTLLFDEYQRLGLDIVTVSERMEDWRRERVSDESAAAAAPSAAAVARQNTQSLGELQAAMASIGGMPG